jgi:hypothetical protein
MTAPRTCAMPAVPGCAIDKGLATIKRPQWVWAQSDPGSEERLFLTAAAMTVLGLALHMLLRRVEVTVLSLLPIERELKHRRRELIRRHEMAGVDVSDSRPNRQPPDERCIFP